VRRAKGPAAPAVVSIATLAEAATQARKWRSGTPELTAWAHDRVTAVVAELYPGLDTKPEWLPTLTADQARTVYDTLAAEKDPLEIAEDRDALEREKYRADPHLTAAELLTVFGTSLADPAVSVPAMESWGPLDPPGPLRQEAARRGDRLIAGELDDHRTLW